MIASEEELTRGLKAGDTKTISSVYDMYSGSLYGIIYRILKNEECSQDVLQETFVKIWQCADLYDPSKGRLFTWMSRIAKNLSIDQMKSRGYRNCSKNEDISDLQHIVDGQFSASDNPNIIGIRQIAMALEPKYRSILELIYFQGYTHAEAAEELSIPMGTLKTRIRMAVNTLRQAFN